MRRLAALLALLAAGCSNTAEPPLSSELSTNALMVAGSLQSNGEAILALAVLETAARATVTLSGDRLLLSDGADETDFAAYDSGYVALLETSTTEPALILARGTGERVSVTLPLPPAFALTPPPDASPLTAPFTFSWDEHQGAASITVTSPCFTEISRALALDVGTYTVQPADLAFVSDLAACDVTIVVSRSTTLSASAPALAEPVSMSVEQIRTVRFTGTR